MIDRPRRSYAKISRAFFPIWNSTHTCAYDTCDLRESVTFERERERERERESLLGGVGYDASAYLSEKKTKLKKCYTKQLRSGLEHSL